jgi:hypothetical protein
MDKHTQNLKDMIQRMTELDTDEQKKQKLDESISITADSADELASLAKMLGNAGMSEPEAQGAQTMPMRQDMERLSGIMQGADDAVEESDEECACCGEVHYGACYEDGPHECSCCGEYHDGHNEGIEEDNSRNDSSEREQLMDLVQRAEKNDRRAKSEFETYVGQTFDVDAPRLLMKLTRLDQRDRARAIEELIKSKRDQGEYQTAAQGVRRNELQFSGYDNEPDADYQDSKYMTKDLAGGLNREKGAYADAEDGDNPMAVKEGESQKRYESIKDSLYAQLTEKKKADKDYDKDGKIETPKAEYQGSKIRAAKKKGNMKKDK